MTCATSGHDIEWHKLQDRTGARLTCESGQVVEGPFMETKEAVGGVFLIQDGSLQESHRPRARVSILELQNGLWRCGPSRR